MRKLIVWGLTIVMTVFVAPAAAQDAEALRRELEQMRKSFDQMRQEYQRNMDALSERLKKLEVTAPAPVAVPQTTPVGTGMSPATPSAMDLLRPREPFALSPKRGAGQLLFDIGLAGDFVGNIVQKNVDKAGAGTFRNRENRFFPREIEMALFGQIDPYARGEIRIEAREDARGQETAVALAEAHLTLMALPFNTQAKMGQMRNRYGWSNQIHEHDLPWIDRPNVHRNYFGDEGLVEKGFELTWVPDLPFYLEVLGGAFNSDNARVFGRGRISEPLVTGRIRTFFELTDEHALQLGISVASGVNADRQRNTLPGFDARYKYRPDRWLHPLLTLGGEGLWSIRRAERTRQFDIPGPLGDPLTITSGNHHTRTRFGYYAYAELQPWKRWAFGARYDYTELLVRGREKAIEPYVSFWPSEFLRFRAGYKLTERSSDAGFAANNAMARSLDEWFLQASFVLGAHPKHSF
jgi:hypothetical protein